MKVPLGQWALEGRLKAAREIETLVWTDGSVRPCPEPRSRNEKLLEDGIEVILGGQPYMSNA